MSRLAVSLVPLALVASCGESVDSGSGTATGFWRGNITLVNSHWRDLLRNQDTLRPGQALYLQTVNPALVEPGATYRLTVENLGTGATLVDVDPRSDSNGMFEMTPVLNDVGQEDGIAEGDRLRVGLELGTDQFGVEVIVAGRAAGPGEFGALAADPLVQATDAAGRPVNSFVVAGAAPGETYGPVYVTGHGFPAGVTEVDIYVVEDRDRWAGQTIPRHFKLGLMAGPIKGKLVDGRLPPTNTAFKPSTKQLGAYDILVDVDRNGVFDYEQDHKDGADGEAKVGFTVQYSREWLAELKDKHLLVNLAFDGPRRRLGTWRNIYNKGDKVFVYVNPPVNREHHGTVIKWVVAHRDFAQFWDQPLSDGTVPFSYLSVGSQQTLPQKGCTNTPPVYVIDADRYTDPELGVPIDRYDIVLDYNKDGRYTAGVDILDVAGVDSGMQMLSPETVRNLAPERQGGFRVQ